MEKLTTKQQMIIKSIQEYIECKKENPTCYRLHKFLNEQGSSDSLKSVLQVIEALERKEMIRRDENKKIYEVKKNNQFQNFKNIFSIPVYGLASCGEALAFAEDNVDGFLQISKSLFRATEPANLFAVKTLGDSMDKDNINDGDYVIFEKYEGGAELEGRIVVAVINGMATIKRYRKVSKDVIGLFPHSTNPFHQPIYIHKSDSVLIAGIFKKVLPVKFVSL